MNKPLLSVAGVLAIVFVSFVLIQQGKPQPPAPPPIATPIVRPNVITVNTPTTVIVTVFIPDPTLNPASVELLRVNVNGTRSSVLGQMYDDGRFGDEKPGDKVFTAKQSLLEATQGYLTLQVRASFRGRVRETLSPVKSIPIQGFTLSALGAASQSILEGTVTTINALLDETTSRRVSSIMVHVIRSIKGGISPNSSITLYYAVSPPRSDPIRETGMFSLNDHVLLFLTAPDRRGFYHLSYGPLAKWMVDNTPTLGDIAVADVGYESVNLPQGLDSSFRSLLMRSSHRQLTVDEFLAEALTQ